MRILSEAEILKPEVRKQIIEEIKGGENQRRKAEAFKRYQCLKDQTSAYTIAELQKQFDQSTIQEMSYCIANVSLVRKCIDKLAKVYSYGVVRKVTSEDAGVKGSKKDLMATERIEQLSKKLSVNKAMKQANKYVKLQRNCAIYVKPCPGVNENEWDIKIQPLSPFLYDVVEDYNDRTKPMAFILSDYEVNMPSYTTQDAASVDRTAASLPISLNKGGDGRDQKIADTPSDAQTGSGKEYIWWTKNYHFTTSESGEYTKAYEKEEQRINMIQELPFVNLAIDQDGQFWAIGGSDLVDGAILINSVLTHNQHIATTQGYGQFWMKGSNLPRNLKMGPSKALLMEYKDGEPVPEMGFAAASPNLDSLRALVEQYIALLLTTNNLSTSAVSAQLSGAMSAPSGVAMIIDKAESIEDVNEQREIFSEAEPHLWKIISKYIATLGSRLKPDIAALKVDEGLAERIVTKFNEPQSIQSEQEKLSNLKLRKELGLNTMVDLIMRDNPDMTTQDAEEKLMLILKDKMNSMMTPTKEDDGEEKEDEDGKGDDDGLGDELHPGPVGGARGAESGSEGQGPGRHRGAIDRADA